MTVIRRTSNVSHTPAQMYELVDDIETYPEFLPWCKSSEILSRDEDEVRATLQLARGGLQKSFTTCNRLQKNKMIEVRLISGPFKHLEGFWRFETVGDTGCCVSLDLEFEFANKLLSMAIGPIFNQIASTMVESFCQRAQQLYVET